MSEFVERLKAGSAARNLQRCLAFSPDAASTAALNHEIAKLMRDAAGKKPALSSFPVKTAGGASGLGAKGRARLYWERGL